MSSESRCKSTMLRKIRIGISALFCTDYFLFLDFAEILPNSFHRLAHLQFVPALLSLSVGILLFLIVLTLLFGRIYCSTICPMGICKISLRACQNQQVKEKRYSYSPAKIDYVGVCLGDCHLFSMRIHVYRRTA